MGLPPVRAVCLCDLSVCNPLLSVFMADGGGDKGEHHATWGSMWEHIVQILNLLRHLTQGAVVTFKENFDRHGWGDNGMKFKWQIDKGGLWQAYRTLIRRKTSVLPSIHIEKRDIDTYIYPLWINWWHFGLINPTFSIDELWPYLFFPPFGRKHLHLISLTFRNNSSLCRCLFVWLTEAKGSSLLLMLHVIMYCHKL